MKVTFVAFFIRDQKRDVKFIVDFISDFFIGNPDDLCHLSVIGLLPTNDTAADQGFKKCYILTMCDE